MPKVISKTISSALSLWLIYRAFKQAGWAVAVCFTLMWIAFELIALWQQQVNENMAAMVENQAKLLSALNTQRNSKGDV